MNFPTFLTHYYEAADGPLRSLTELPPADSEAVLERIRREGGRFASRRAADYLAIRRELEERIRALFIERGGQPRRQRPHYFILGECDWLRSWYSDGRELRLPLTCFDPRAVSFTYGDSFPAMRFQDGKPYRGKVYTLEDLPALVSEFGLPQVWNAKGKLGPERYIEAQVWEDGFRVGGESLFTAPPSQTPHPMGNSATHPARGKP